MCPDCGLKVERVPQLPGKAPFSIRFEYAVGVACESTAARQVARQFRLAESTMRAIDLCYLGRRRGVSRSCMSWASMRSTWARRPSS